MLAEVNEVQAYFKKKFGEGKPVPAADYAVPTQTSRGPAFMRIVVSKDQKLSDFHLFWDKEFKISWYDFNKDGSKRTR